MIYIHAPFCRQKCLYCDFNSFSGIEHLIDPYVRALLKEIEKADIKGPVKSIFFGGGNPLLLGAENLILIMETIGNRFTLDTGVEITIETNPESAKLKSLVELTAAGVNRISLGFQSLDDKTLRVLGRRHTAMDNYKAYQLAREAGLKNINVDLIFSVPGQSLDSWKETINGALNLKPEHISAYCLTVEKNTPLKKLIAGDALTMPSDQTITTMMKVTADLLKAGGYGHYEVSNYALPGYECRHNLNYWRGGDYFGFGAGAHSHFNGRRWSNLSSVNEYMKAIEGEGNVVGMIEELTVEDKIFELIFLGLRTDRGVVTAEIRDRYGVDIGDRYKNELRMLSDEGLADVGERIVLTEKGLTIADAVAELLM